ncbi:hypothetical protein SAMN05216388_101168 [Halorientalis persicus]|jgi:large-conductance mechanosensitive channel|uniref:Uncharacterized protein n=1 Tax=Halorientalis persicus TaxID=1367881 RepID=A0A1H8NVZ8_9EURY|nr:hypothetical protein [Halorientalis persicus]SEO33800.1 hypothetical protein SAMN05216388_101168 [Halorientalis persicus]
MVADSVRARLGEPVAALWLKFDRQLFALSPRASRLLALLVIAASALAGVVMLRVAAATLAMPVAAQAQSQVREVVCESGVPIDTLIAFAVAAISLFLLVKAVIQGTVAFNKLGSSRAQQQFEGKQALAGAGKTAAGAFVPPLFVGVLGTVLGFDLGGCLLGSLDAGAILTTAASLPL